MKVPDAVPAAGDRIAPPQVTRDQMAGVPSAAPKLFAESGEEWDVEEEERKTGDKVAGAILLAVLGKPGGNCGGILGVWWRLDVDRGGDERDDDEK